MFGKMFGNLFDKEQAVKDTVENAIEDHCEELHCNPEEMWYMIKPTGKNFEFKVYLYKTIEGKQICHREVTVKELVDGTEET